MNNNKQLCLAWTMYAGDNADRLAPNPDGNHLGQPSQESGIIYPVSWAGGLLDWSGNPANTNTIYLTDDVHESLLALTLAKSPKVFWCPADHFLSPIQRGLGWNNRMRSIAMDAAVGDGVKYLGFSWSGGPPKFWWAMRMSELTLPGPAQSWVFCDEHPDSIDDCILYTDAYCTNGTGSFTELPACDHNGACGVGFADGHAEIHKWRDGQTAHPVTYTVINDVATVNNPDLAWLAQMTPRSQ